MNDFKVGDEVWWFEEMWLGKPRPLDKLIIRTSIIKNNWFGKCSIEGVDMLYSEDCFYKSKNEAIDAMIKHLESMRDE